MTFWFHAALLVAVLTLAVRWHYRCWVRYLASRPGVEYHKTISREGKKVLLTWDECCLHWNWQLEDLHTGQILARGQHRRKENAYALACINARWL